MKSIVLATAILLSACGGQVSAKPLNVCLQPSDRIVAMKGCDAVIQPTPELDPVKSAAIQAALGPVVIGWIGGDMAPDKVSAQGAITKDIVNRAPELLDAMAQYQNIPWVYVADEFGWCDSGHCVYDYVNQLLTITRKAHSVNKKVLISMLPATLAQYPDAPMDGINEIDGIAFDIYPSMMLAADFGNCTFSSNPYETMLFCAIQKVRRMGFTGQIGYIAQGFRLATDTDADLLPKLQLQRQALENAGALGVTATMSWGCYLGAKEQAREPIVPLCGTMFESLVTP